MEIIDNYRNSAIVLKRRIKERLNKDNIELGICYGAYSDFVSELGIIVNRIKEDVSDIEEIDKQIFEDVKKNVKIEEPQRYAKILHHFSRLNLDIKDFFIHTRIFLDTICRIIKISYGKKGEMLPLSMSDLLKNKASLDIDNAFFQGLRQKMTWFDEFRSHRVRIEHRLSEIKMATGFGEKFKFQILKSFTESWGSETMQPLLDYIVEIVSNLKELSDFLNLNIEFGNK